MQSNSGFPKTKKKLHMPDFCLSGCPSSWLHAYTLPTIPDPKLQKILSTAFKVWPLMQLIWGMYVCGKDLQFSIFLQSQTIYWVHLVVVGICTQMSMDPNATTRAPPATNYRNWKWTVAGGEPTLSVLANKITLLLFSLSTETWFLKTSEDAVHRKCY